LNRLVRDCFSGILFVSTAGLVALILAYPSRIAHGQAPASKAASAPAGNAQNGKKLYNSYGCYQCHGYAGQGGAGPRVGPKPIPFQAFVQYVRTPKNQMPPYTSKVLKDSELADIYAFLQSLPEPPKAKDIPLLNND
jgi:mono/diheme cytochrome c family protein